MDENKDIELLPGQVWEKKSIPGDLPSRILINSFDDTIMEELDLYSIMILNDGEVLNLTETTGMTGKTIKENYDYKKTVDLPWIKTEEELMNEYYSQPGMQFA